MQSSDPDTASRPSDVTATALTEPVCPASVARSVPFSRSHTFTMRSSDPDTASRPSDVTATALTERLCPPSVARSVPFSRSHTITVK